MSRLGLDMRTAWAVELIESLFLIEISSRTSGLWTYGFFIFFEKGGPKKNFHNSLSINKRGKQSFSALRTLT
jgi:hypothetical protein